jgi:drug/metabolite transporter (DMT)-like permease
LIAGGNVINNNTKIILLTAAVIIAFAGNSLLTRLALANGGIEPAQFVGIRLISGAVMLSVLLFRHSRALVPRQADVTGILSLFVYGVAFTFAYISLGAATGALIAFPMVQVTLAAIATLRGAALSLREIAGMLIALAGIVVLLLPGASAPSLGPALLMALAGAAWGVYTMDGRGAPDPLPRTARNFIGTVPLAIIILIAFPSCWPNASGLILAISSGAITSGLGYAVWYTVLPRLNVATAGAVQLLVPIITAAGGVWWLGEAPSLKLMAVAILVLGGIWLTQGEKKPRLR